MIYILVCLLFVTMSFFSKKKELVFVAGAIIIIMFALRSYDVGSDTKPYIDFFLGKKTAYYYGSSLGDYKNLSVINTILRPLFFENGTLYLLFISIFFTLPYILLIRKYSRNGTLAFVLFFVFNCYLTYMLAIRQVFSLGFIFWAIFLFLNRVKWYKILSPLFIVIGGFLHFSSIPVICVFTISYFIKLNNKVAALLIFSSSVICYYLSDVGQIINFFFRYSSDTDLLSRIDNYSTWTFDQKNSLLYYIGKGLIPALLVYCASKNEQKSIFFNCFVLGEIIYLLGLGFFMIERTVFGIIVLGIISMSNVLIIPPKKVLDYIPWVVISYNLYVFVMGIINWNYKENLSAILPYSFIFE